jgi:hypothetical protein
MPGLHRLLRVTPKGLLRIDRKKIAVEANLDGKYPLRCSDPHLPAEDIALGYKQLLQVERGWRDMKTTLELRPVYHRLEDRIRAHVILCWLALLLVRIVETTTNNTWRGVREDLQELHVGTFQGHLPRSRRHVPPAHRAHRRATRHPHRAQRRPTQEDHRTRTTGCSVLTRTNLTAWTHVVPAIFAVLAGHNPDSVSSPDISCGTRGARGTLPTGGARAFRSAPLGDLSAF